MKPLIKKDKEQRGKSKQMHFALSFLLSGFLAGHLVLVLAGCENAYQESSALWQQNKELMQEKTELKNQIEELRSKNNQLKKQIKVLSGLKPETKLEDLYNLQKIKITRRSGLYDKDKDGKKEKLILYIRPIDNEGDAIKAAGVVDVQLWDLNKEPEKAKLGKWQIKPDELKKLWVGTIMTGYYRLTLDAADDLTGQESELTVKVGFTDYLTGKVLAAQKVIKP